MNPKDQQVLNARLTVASKQVEERRRYAHRFPERVWDLIDALKSLASIREEVADFDRAERLYREALGHARSARKPRSEVIFGLQSHLGYLYDRLAEPEKAINAYQQALDLADSTPVTDPEGLGVVNNNLALLHKNRGEFAQAERRYDIALDALRQSPIEATGPKVASVYNNLGVLHYTAQNPAKALEMHQRALTIREQAAKGNPGLKPDVRQSFNNLAHVYRTLGDASKADFYARQAEEAGAHLLALAGHSGDTERPL
jgi:tetratricopeptide (TPR) repeat protein